MNVDSVRKRIYQGLIGIFVLAVTAVSFSSTTWNPAASQIAQAAPMQQTQPVISFEKPADNIIEPDNGEDSEITIKVKINVAPEAGQEAKVNYSTTNGTAIAGVDYEATLGTLTFSPGSTDSQSFTVTIFGNNSDEPDKVFSVFLTNAVNATVGVPGSTTITIVDNDSPSPTNTPTPTPGGEVFIDDYEPNNEISTATEVAAGQAKLTNITLWPVGDEDYFKFYGKKGSTYSVFTADLGAGLDTVLKVYNPDGNKIGENDDFEPTNPRSQFQFTAGEDGFYYARVLNQSATNSTGLQYSFEIDIIIPPTPTPTATRVGQPDTCEPNNTLGTACLIGTDEVKQNMNFVPPTGTETDNDFYRLAVKVGILYTCETSELSAITDTNMIFLDNNGNDFNPQLGNDDRAPGDRSSVLSWLATYTGNLYILVGPVNPPPYEDTPLTNYNLTCRGVAATPTPAPTATVAFVPPSTGGGVVPSPTAVPFPTFPPTPTPIDLASFLTATPPPPPIVDFIPLPTSTPAAGASQTTSVQVTVFYDRNFNYMAELDEGIMDVAVELFDNATGELMAFGYTNEAGVVRFEGIVSTGAVRVQVSYLNYSQIITGASANILLRVEPRPLPGGIP